MHPSPTYLISVSICLGIVYLVYLALFRSTTFFMANRYYLLGGLIFSFVAPVLDVPFSRGENEIFSTHPSATALQSQISDYIPAVTRVLVAGSVEYSPILPIVYYAGIVIALLRIWYSVQSILRIKNRAEMSYSGNFKILQADIGQPFSFFNIIFLPKGHTDAAIIEHEKVHIRQLHVIDLIVVEAARVFLWFNPLINFYARSLKAQHEYCADASTIGERTPVEDYLKLLWCQIQAGNSPGPISHFYSKSIKNRIIMLTKKKTSSGFYGLYFLLIPMGCMLLFAFSNKPDVRSFIPAEPMDASEFTVIVDPGHGGADAGARATSGLSEKELTLLVAKEIQVIGRRNGLNVILTRSDDESITLAERISRAGETSASLFLSLHVNTHDDISRSGIECVISENNIAFEQSKNFSDLLLSELRSLDGIKVNGIMKSDFYVLSKNSKAAIALELGYLSNDSDYRFIRDVHNQKMLAERIVSSVIKHLK